MSKALVVANWKMNPATLKEAQKLLEATKVAAEKEKTHVVVAPPAIFLRDLAARSRGKRVSFAIQHAHAEEHGAHTGEISLLQAKDAKAKYVLIGHAERRALGETDADTGKKVVAALHAGLVPILCVGETKRDAGGEYFNTIAAQLRAALADAPVEKLSRVIIVYEPLWTIGGDKTMDPREMHTMAIFIRKTIVDTFGQQGFNMTILYGGSVDAATAPPMLRDGDIHGFLVGRASWDAVEFGHLLQAIAHT